ncbi:hypothetical protein [Actinomadura sp. KC06]|uniref:hypothetical protein n=1 Tax=Actinomadura sp. KC06 TaxID=2530369 RepID=UPI0014051857
MPCSSSMIRKIEQGDRPATPSLLAAVARVVHVAITDLTGQPYRSQTEGDDRVRDLIPPRRREVSAYNMAPADSGGPLPELSQVRERVEAANKLAHNMVIFKLGQALPSVLYDLRALVHALPDGGRREQAMPTTGIDPRWKPWSRHYRAGEKPGNPGVDS